MLQTLIYRTLRFTQLRKIDSSGKYCVESCLQVCTAISTVLYQNLCNTTKDMLPASCCEAGNFYRIPGSNAMPYHDDLCILAWSIKFSPFLAGFNSIRTTTLMQRTECSQQPDSLLQPRDQHVCIYFLRTNAALNAIMLPAELSKCNKSDCKRTSSDLTRATRNSQQAQAMCSSTPQSGTGQSCWHLMWNRANHSPNGP